ncbi:hypothetical protein D3C86_1234210 [compost metagenome]
MVPVSPFKSTSVLAMRCRARKTQPIPSSCATCRLRNCASIHGTRCWARNWKRITTLGMLNTRMKDYFDLWILARQCDFDAAILAKAIRSTFERRGTSIPPSIPFGLTPESRRMRKKLSNGPFQRKNALDAASLRDVVEVLEKFLWPVLMNAPRERLVGGLWSPGIGWHIPGSGSAG